MPFKSRAQAKWMFAAENRHEVPKGTAKRWAHHTKSIKSLPAHAGKGKKKHKKKAGVYGLWDMLYKQAEDKTEAGSPNPSPVPSVPSTAGQSLLAGARVGRSVRGAVDTAVNWVGDHPYLTAGGLGAGALATYLMNRKSKKEAEALGRSVAGIVKSAGPPVSSQDLLHASIHHRTDQLGGLGGRIGGAVGGPARAVGGIMSSVANAAGDVAGAANRLPAGPSPPAEAPTPQTQGGPWYTNPWVLGAGAAGIGGLGGYLLSRKRNNRAEELGREAARQEA